MDETTQSDSDPDSPAYQQYSTGDGKGRILPQSESESEIIVAEDDAEILTDGGEPSLVGNTGASEGTDIEADETRAFRVRTMLSDEETAREVRQAMIEAGIRPDRIEIVEERVAGDPR